MIVDKSVLEKLRGVLPCTSVVEFTTIAHRGMLEDEELKNYTPKFRCRQLTIGENETVKQFLRDSKEGSGDRTAIIEILKAVVLGWSNLYDISTGEEFVFSPENVAKLPEMVQKSIITDLWQYAGSTL